MELNYKSFLGNEYDIIIDRSAGSTHPKHKNIVYPINYGYIEGIMAEDGEEVDVYVLDIVKPVKKIKAKIIAIIHRLNDDENKLVAVASDKIYTNDEIDKITNFQEQYYKHKIIR